MKKLLTMSIIFLLLTNIFFIVKWQHAEQDSIRQLAKIHHTWKLALYEVSQGDVNNFEEILPAAYVLQLSSYQLLDEMSQRYNIKDYNVISDDLTFIYTAIKKNNKEKIAEGISNAKNLYETIENITNLSEYKEPLESYIHTFQ